MIYSKMAAILTVLGLTGCMAGDSPEKEPAVYNYKIQSAGGAEVIPAEGGHLVSARNGFRLVLVPEEGEIWDLGQASVLGLTLENTGQTELVLDLMVGNQGANGWSNSSVGRTIIEAGETIPLGVALWRRTSYAETDPAYLRMSGHPDGTFRHWHKFDPSQARNFVISNATSGEHQFKLGKMYALQGMREDLQGKFPFIDKYGQYIHREWPDKVHSDKDIRKGIAIEEELVDSLPGRTGFTRYGGWMGGPRFEPTGYFRTVKHDGRWWFADPEGYLFWSYGVNCVGVEYAGQTPVERDLAVFEELPKKDDPEFGQFHTQLDVEDNFMLLEDVPHYDFTRANLYRKYGDDWEEKMIQQDIRRMKYTNLNTIGAWSDYDIAKRKEIPYTVMLHYEYGFAADKLPDPYDDETREGLRKAIREYPVDFKNDPWCLGAFVNNELHWKSDARHMVAAILGYKEEQTAVKEVFRDWLKNKYESLEAFNAAWSTAFPDWESLASCTDADTFKRANRADCSALATVFGNAFFGMVREELNAYSPNILFLGSRFNSGSKEVINAAARFADVISANVYHYNPDAGSFANTDKPTLISEFHFANVTGNNLGSGLRSAQDALQQGRLFRAFMEAAVKDPRIIGAHWYQWRDQSVGGRYDGENYDVGFFDVADLPNPELIRAAEEYGRNLYSSVN